MNNPHIFNFKADISTIVVGNKINNPFSTNVPAIAKIAAKEFQEFIALEAVKWSHDFQVQKGKMFGVLVVQQHDNSLGYLAAISGKLPENANPEKFIPSVFDNSTDDYFINRGMTELSEIGSKIKATTNQIEIDLLKSKSKEKSKALQQQLFRNYQFLNSSGQEKNLLQIFKDSTRGNPPSAAGECAAPKLLNYAFKNNLKPIALAEFWWGKDIQKIDNKSHKSFYPACKNRCRPILEYMLGDTDLFNEATQQELVSSN